MTRFVNTRHPELWVHPLGVRFSGGVAEVDDPAIAARLANIAGVNLAEGETLPGTDTSGDEQGSTPETGGEQPAGTSDEPDPDAQEQPAAEEQKPQPPAISEPKAAHVDYAVTELGRDRADVESMTKADIAEWIRARLAERG